MDQNHFRSILRKYLDGKATPEEEKIINSWYHNMEREGDSLHENDVEPGLEHHYWSLIDARVRPGRRFMMKPWTLVGIAASLLIAVGAFLYLVRTERTEANLLAAVQTQQLEWEGVFNSGKVKKIVALADGSVVTLEPQSRLKFSPSFNGRERAVYLEGEAFFDVARDETRPFFVFTRQLTTRVLGTSFRIRAFEQDEKVTVAVKSGTVSVSASEAIEQDKMRRTEIVLTANQQVVFDKVYSKLTRTIVDDPQAILPPEEIRQMRFEAAPVTEIFAAIEKVYGVDLVFDVDTFRACRLTSVISDGGLYNRLDIICNAIGATYRLQENHIIIEGAGCDNQ